MIVVEGMDFLDAVVADVASIDNGVDGDISRLVCTTAVPSAHRAANELSSAAARPTEGRTTKGRALACVYQQSSPPP